jgi:cellobiose phosphorylase
MAFARLGDNRRAWELFTMINMVNDGIEQPDKSIPLVDDHREHRVEVRVSATGT